jgi:Beta-propeller repeat/NHL repeat
LWHRQGTRNDTGLALPTGILVDSSIYVANEVGNLTVYSLDANGDAAPAATLSNPATGLNGPTAIALDTNGKAFVANSFLNIGNPSGSVTVYPAGGYGVAGVPSATITGSNTGLMSPTGIAVDSNDNIYVSNESPSSVSNGSITVYTAGSNGNVTPSATIVAANTGSGTFDPMGIALDPSGNIYVPSVAAVGHSISYAVDVLPSGSNGTVTPSSVIVGLQTQLEQPSGIALDSQRNIYVTNRATNSVTVFAAGSSGNVAPTSVISGSNTGLTSPIGVGVDSSGNIYVVNSANTGGGDAGSVTVYSAGSNGNVAPIQTISGGDTGLFTPSGLALGFISQ